MTNIKDMIANRIRALVSHSGAEGGSSSGRWNMVKEMIYVLVNGPFQPNEKRRTKTAKYLSVDLTTFEYEKFDDETLVLIYETVVRRYIICM